MVFIDAAKALSAGVAAGLADMLMLPFRTTRSGYEWMVVFDLDCNIHGAAAIVVRQPLMPRCLSEGEIDANIKSSQS